MVSSAVQRISSFGLMKWLLSDQKTHLTSSIMRQLTEDGHMNYVFFMVYCSSADTKAELLCKVVLRAAKGLISERKLVLIQLPALRNCVRQ